MISEERLRQAAAELGAKIDVPVEEHSFSTAFEAKMNKLLNKTSKPIWRQGLSGVVAAMLALVLLCGVVLAFSPNVRAAVAKWFVTRSDDLVHIQGQEDPQQSNNHRYQMTFLPEDCSFVTEMSTGNGTTLLYQTADGRSLQFTYLSGGDLYVATTGCTFQTVTVKGFVAEAYVSNDATCNKTLLWQSEDGAVIFLINGPYSLETLISMAESVEQTQAEEG